MSKGIGWMAAIILLGICALLYMENREAKKVQATYADSMRVYRQVRELDMDLIRKIDSIGYLIPKHQQAITNYIRNYNYEVQMSDSLTFDSLSTLLRADIQAYMPRQY